MRGAGRWGSNRYMRYIWLAALAATLLIAVLVQTRAQPAPGEGAQVLSADAALSDALRGGDRAAARKLLSLQFTFADENGAVVERKAFLADLKGAAAGPATDASVALYGLVAMVTGKHKTALGNDAFFINIWAKQKGAWRALTMQDVVVATTTAPPAAVSRLEAKSYECKNPCQTIPYRVRSPAEQDVVNAFQAIEKAVVAHDASEWSKHIADEFVLYRSDDTPMTKADRVAAIERQKQTDAAVTPSEIETMRLVVYGDGAAMVAMHVTPDDAHPPYRAARVWVRRNGQWLMAISVQTDIKDNN